MTYFINRSLILLELIGTFYEKKTTKNKPTKNLDRESNQEKR